MIILGLLKYVGSLLAFVFLTLSIASGLYYISELVEEHSEFSRRVLKRMIYAVLGTHLLLIIFDRQPFFLTAFSAGAHYVYSLNLRQFPFIRLSSPIFITSCLLVAINHYLWFQHFAHPPRPKSDYDYYRARTDSQSYPTFGEISAFFGICVWLVPFSLFVSLSAGDNILPSTTDMTSTPTAGIKKRPGLAKEAVDGVREWVQSTAEWLGITKPQYRYAA